MPSLSDRLKALGMVPASKVEAPKARTQLKISDIVPGKEVTNSLGTCYFTEQLYPWNYQHGKVIFLQTFGISTIADATKASQVKGENVSRLLFLDTETTGLSGGTGTLAFLVGLGYFNDQGFVLNQYLCRDPLEEPAMLLEIANLAENFSGLVTFNGKSFDIPLLNSRFILNRLPKPFENYSHLDLLHLSRKLWRNRLQSRALQDLEQQILEIPRTSDEIPGWMIPEIYFDYLRTGNAEPIKGVLYHNGMDIVSLAALFVYLADSFDSHTLAETFHPIDYFSMGVLYNDIGRLDLAESIYADCFERHLLDTDLNISLHHRLGDLYKRQGKLAEAIQVWMTAAELEDIDSIIELAKYYEHAQCEYTLALEWTEKAVLYLDKKGYHSYQNRQLKKDLIKRKERLTAKSERKNTHVSQKNS